MKIPRNAESRDTARLILVTVVATVIGLGVLFYIREPLLLLIRPSYWTNLLSDREAAGSVLGSLIGGLLTITAGVLTVLFYRHQQRDTNWTNFFRWLTDFHCQFHRDPQFAEIRMKLATKRVWIRRQLARELMLDGDLPEKDVLEADRAILCARNVNEEFQLDWMFLREITDYFYFFEQILIFGETLYYVNSAGNALVLVDHFGWFLRSLFVSWDQGTSGPDEARRAERLFILYLANNRYLRLTSAALVLMQSGSRANIDAGFRSELFEEAKAALLAQGQVLKSWNSLRELDEYWIPIVGRSGFVAH
jgi:hypothetical protein